MGRRTSQRTRKPFLRVLSGYSATGLSRQSELRPSACWVELPSNPHIGRSETDVGALSTTFVLLRRLGSGRYPSNQMYSSLNLFSEDIQRSTLIKIGTNRFGLAHPAVRQRSKRSGPHPTQLCQLNPHSFGGFGSDRLPCGLATNPIRLPPSSVQPQDPNPQ